MPHPKSRWPRLAYLTRGIGSAEIEKLRAAPDVWFATHLAAVQYVKKQASME